MLKIGFPISLKNPIFRQLYFAQTVSLFGDALTWLGLALLAFELAGKSAPVVLAGALTLRVTAFTLLSPSRGGTSRQVRSSAHFDVYASGADVAGLSITVRAEYLANLCTGAGFEYPQCLFLRRHIRPQFPSSQVKPIYRQAIALSGTTYQILGVFGPGLAGVLALFIGARDLFFWDGVSFLVAAILIGTLPGGLRSDVTTAPQRRVGSIGSDILAGTERLWADAPIRYGLMLQLVASIAGAQILVNTVGYVQGTLHQTAVEYGWVMMGFGLGATLGTIAIGMFPQYRSKIMTLFAGGAMINIALLGANYVGLAPLILPMGDRGLWAKPH